MTAMIDSWTWWAATTLLAASLQGTVAVAVVWLVCRRLTTISAAMRALLWWVATLGFVLALTPLPSLRIPLLPGPAPIVSIPMARNLSPRPLETTAPIASQTNRVESQYASRTDRGIRTWAIAAVVLWMAVLATHVVRLVYAYVKLRAVVHRSTPLNGDDAEAVARIAAALGLKRLPSIRVSGEIETPLVAGLPRAIVLIPASAIATLSPHERAMAIGHELAHVRRHDLLLAWVPAIAERLFFFHPLARLASREYAAERESACDALVLDTLDVAPHDYGRMLVRLGIAAANPVFTMGGSPPTVSSLRRRLDMLHDAPSTRPSRAILALVTLIAVAAVLPLRLVAATPPSEQQAAAPAAPGSAQAPAKPVVPAPPQPVTPAAPASAARPVAPRAARQNTPDNANVEQALAEQRRNMQRIEEALAKLSAELSRQRNSQSAQELELARAQENMRRMLEVRQAEERLQATARRDSEQQTTTQFLEDRLHALTAEHEQTSARLRALSAEIDAIRQKLDEARRAQEPKK
jgi:bla regulator protein blaR1